MNASINSINKVVFFPGLNTYGDGQLHIGPIDLGPIDQFLAQKFRNFGLDFIMVPNGSVPEAKGENYIEEQVIKFRDFVECHPFFGGTERPKTGTEPFGEMESRLRTQNQGTENLHPPIKYHFLGHSAGGLIARASLYELKRNQTGFFSKVASITTIGTPHFGSELATLTLDFAKSRSLLKILLQTTNYDLQSRWTFFSGFTPMALANFNLKYPNLSEIAYYSVVCGGPMHQLPFYFQLLWRVLQKKTTPFSVSDGIVECLSQKWGTTIGIFELDHFSQLGFTSSLLKRLRHGTKKEFNRMIQTIVSHQISSPMHF